MNDYTIIRSPMNQLPITLINKAIRQKVHRHLHCIECGKTIAEITDKVVIVSDGMTTLEQLRPDEIGIVDIQCKYHNCKQMYRMEFAT